MSTEPPKDEGFKPQDVDQVIQHFGRPLEGDRKHSLMEKLKKEQKRTITLDDISLDKERKGRKR